MKTTTTSLCLLLLLNQLQVSRTSADEGLSTTQMNTDKMDQESSSTSATESSHPTADHSDFADPDINDTRADCLMDTELGLIAMGSAGGLILCLLLTTVALACQICYLQKRVYMPRTSRSNTNLVDSASYWDTDRADAGGLVGPCDPSVVLEEVRKEAKADQERPSKIDEEDEEARVSLLEGATAMEFNPEEKESLMLSSGSKDFSLEVPKDLEDMPLVV